MAKRVVGIIGWIFVVIGILGFIPGITSDGMLIGLFEVDAVHNIVHLITGILLVWLAMRGEDSARMIAKVFGVIYALVTILGFVGGDNVLGIMMNNMADNILHLVLALILLWAGFMGGKKAAPAAM
jgi:hypothetical protein